MRTVEVREEERNEKKLFVSYSSSVEAREMQNSRGLNLNVLRK